MNNTKNKNVNTDKSAKPNKTLLQINSIAQKEIVKLSEEIDNLKTLAEYREKTLKQRKAYDADPKRKYDVEVLYPNGSKSRIRTFPPDVALFLQSLHSPKEVGKILDECNPVSYIRRVVIPRYKDPKNNGTKNNTPEPDLATLLTELIKRGMSK